MKKILIVVDMQNDFIDGSLGTPQALAIVPSVIKKISQYDSKDIYATRDTHPHNYLDTQEGHYLPVSHCIDGSQGWQIRSEIASLLKDSVIIDKPTFGSTKLAQILLERSLREKLEIEIVGLCTDICVISNALLLKAYMSETRITVDSACCAGVTPEKHNAALEVMKSCQIEVI